MLACAFSCVGLVTLCGFGCASASPSVAPPSAPVHFASAAEIWFHPKPSSAAFPGPPVDGGSTDFLQLFQPNSQWPYATAHTSVIGVYAAWILNATDQMLQNVVTFANAHGMGFEIEAPSLQAPATCGSGVEGYVPYGLSLKDITLQYLSRLKALNAQVPFIKVDEPFYFANVVSDPRACHWPVTQIAADVAAYAQIVHNVYPTTAVGDVEPVIASAYTPDVVTALGNWHDTYQTVTGAPFPFYFADIDFSNPAWPTLVKSLEGSTRQRNMHFGIIYIGDQQDSSDAVWASKAVARFEMYQGQAGGSPDYVLFQSWEPYPALCLPETDPTTFTGVLDAYIKATAPAKR